ncbi:MAG TPA: hypothetical protein VFG82_02925 [Rubrobacter sp.]|nr:hypothetical protein [Rubrobacter sp.]
MRGAREHNLKDITVSMPRDVMVVVTGLSGSGKSSLAFDTIYAEGQRRYVESLSAYARQFLGQMDKPDVDHIDGLSPAVSIDQKTTSNNPRSTVATVTEIYDYLRLLYARAGRPHCHVCGFPVASSTPQQMVEKVLTLPEKTRFMVLAPVVRGRKGEYGRMFKDLAESGFARVRVDGELHELPVDLGLDKNYKHDIEVVVDRLVIREGIERRLTDSIETALHLAEGLVQIETVERDGGGESMLFSESFTCTNCGASIAEIQPRTFSFNSPHGACDRCDGLGSRLEIDPALVVPNEDLSVNEGAVVPWANSQTEYHASVLGALSEKYGIDLNDPWRDLPEEHRHLILFGTDDERIYVSYRNRYNRRRQYMTRFDGVVGNLERRYTETDSEYRREKIEEFMSHVPCPKCGGARLRPEALAVTVGGKNVYEFTELSVTEAQRFLRRGVHRAGVDHRRAGGQRDKGAPGLPCRRRARIPHPEPFRRDALRGRSPEDKARFTGRERSRRCPVRARRALHRAAPARQQASPDHAREAEGPREHAHRRRARRRDDPLGRLRH